MSTKIQLTGGAFQDSEGNVLANGYLKFKLSQDGSVSGVGNICSGVEITITLDADGNVVSSPAQSIWGNDVISPINTFYRVTGYTSKGQPAWGPNNQQVVGDTSFDLGTWVPNQVISWSPPPSGITLEHNGTENSSQTVLNLESLDSTVTITDEGDGNINLSTGSGGGPSVSFMAGPGFITPPYPLNLAGIFPSGDTALDVTCTHFNFLGTLTFNTIAFSFVSGETDINVVFGIYNSSGNLVWTSGAISIPHTTASMETTVTGYTLEPGDYYLAMSTDANLGGLQIIGVGMNTIADTNVTTNILNHSVPQFGLSPNNATSGPLALPSTLGGALVPNSTGDNTWGYPMVMFYNV